MKRAARVLVFVLCVGFTIASIINVFADNSEVEKLAKEVACEAGAPAKPEKPAGNKPAAAAPGLCNLSMTKMARTPFSQSFEYSGGGKTRRIRCVRSLILVGEYACVNE